MITQSALAKKLGIPARTLNGWCLRKEVPFEIPEGQKTRVFSADAVEAVRQKASESRRRQDGVQKRSVPAPKRDRLCDALERIADALESWVTRPSA